MARNRKLNISLALLLTISVKLVNCIDMDYENTQDLCNRCKCQTRSTTYILDCSSDQMQNTLANWPEDATPPNITRIVAHFNKNNLQHLKPLPETSLEVVVFYSHNIIEKLDSGLFVNCINVTSLDLSYNKIKSSELITDVFRGAYNDEKFEPIQLRILNLAHNELHTIGKNVFEHLPELRSLDISGNRFRVIDQLTYLSFKNLPKLEYLNLADNNLIYMNNTAFHDLVKLRILDISGNALDFIPVVIKHVAKTLRTLRVDDNPIIEITESDFSGMDYLVEISATNLSVLDEIKPNAFGTLKNLVKINLSGMPSNVILSDEVFGESLRELNLSNSNLELIPMQFMKWSQLEVLDLRGNQLYCTCDLHNVSAQLQDVVKRDRDAPYCFDFKRYKQYEVYSLSEDICFEHDEYFGAYANMVSTERIMRMILLSTSILLIICLVIAAWLGYVRCFKNQRNYGFASTVSYGPILRPQP